MDDGADSDSSKNGKRPYTLTSQTVGSGQGTSERISGRRRTNNSDEVDVETPGVSSEKSSDREDVDNTGKVSFFGPLIRVAASMNPQQFELPPELVEPIPFPGKLKNCYIKLMTNNKFIVLKAPVNFAFPKKLDRALKKSCTNSITDLCHCRYEPASTAASMTESCFDCFYRCILKFSF